MEKPNYTKTLMLQFEQKNTLTFTC